MGDDWVVLKYGGTSVSSTHAWTTAIPARVRELHAKGHRVWIIVSALSGVTNMLLKAVSDAASGLDHRAAEDAITKKHDDMMAALETPPDILEKVRALERDLFNLLSGIRLIGEATPRSTARVLAHGELCSSWIGLGSLRKVNSEALRVDSRTVLVATDRTAMETPHDRYLSAEVIPHSARAKVEAKVGETHLVISQGFIGGRPGSSDVETCVLGRGGSDTSGTLMACLLEATHVEIWTDVYGMYSADPRLVPTARLIEHVTYREAQELAAMGAKVLHPRCLGPAQWGGFPVLIRNTMDHESPKCTRIGSVTEAGEAGAIAVSMRQGQVLVTVRNLDMWQASGFLSKVFEPFQRLSVGVDLIATSEYAISLTIDQVPGGLDGPTLHSLLTELRAIAPSPNGVLCVTDDVAVVSVVGRRLRTSVAALGDALKCLDGYDVVMMTESAEDLNMSFVLVGNGKHLPRLLQNLHGVLFEN